MADYFLGEIKIVAFDFPPKGWARCDGQLLPILQNQALFSLVGTYYGGNGVNTFGLPDLRGRAPIHMTGQNYGGPLSPRVIGENGGSENVQLLVSQIPSHTHTMTSANVPVVSSAGNMTTPAGNRLAKAGDGEMDRGFPDGFVGGPVIDASGTLVGLGTDRVIRGADLAMTTAQLAPIVDQIVQDGRPKLGWLGVAVQPARLPERLASEVPALTGALVTAIEPKGPADTAGLVVGDVVVALDAATIEGPDTLLALLRNLADKTVSLRLVRGGAVTTLTATVGTRKR